MTDKTHLFAHYRDQYQMRGVGNANASIATGSNEMLVYATKIDSQLCNVSGLIEDLAGWAEQSLHPTFDDNLTAEREARAEALCQRIADSIGNVTREIKAFNAKSLVDKNMQKGQLSQLRNIVVRFREVQANYLKLLRRNRSRPSEDPTPLFDDFDIPFTDVQMTQVALNETELRHRNEQIRELSSQMDRILELFNDLSVLISEHGTMLDRIDGYIESSVENVSQGARQLEQADEHGRRGYRCFYIYIFTCLILCAILFVVIISK